MIADAPLSWMPLNSVAPVCCEARECKGVAVWCVGTFTSRDRAVGATGEGTGTGTGKDRGTDNS